VDLAFRGDFDNDGMFGLWHGVLLTVNKGHANGAVGLAVFLDGVAFGAGEALGLVDGVALFELLELLLAEVGAIVMGADDGLVGVAVPVEADVFVGTVVAHRQTNAN